MKTIWKWEISLGNGTATMPVGAEILTVQMQNGEPQMWAIVDPTARTHHRNFHVVGTGHEVPERATYIGTYQQPELGLVWHLFEIEP